jgi:hypothetical protein
MPASLQGRCIAVGRELVVCAKLVEEPAEGAHVRA